MKQKIVLKRASRERYNRSYVNKSSAKKLSFSRCSYIDGFAEYTIFDLNKKKLNKLIRKLNKFIGSSYNEAIDFLKESFAKETDFNYFMRHFFVKPGNIFVNHKYYCDKNGCLAYYNILKRKNEEIKAFSKDQLIFNRKAKINSVGKVYNEYRGIDDRSSDYYKIKYIGKFYVYANGEVSLKKVYHVPFLEERWHSLNNCTLDINGVHSKSYNGEDVLLYRKGTVDYNRFKVASFDFIPVRIYTDYGEVEYHSHYYESKEYTDNKTGKKYEKVLDLGFGRLNLAIFNIE